MFPFGTRGYPKNSVRVTPPPPLKPFDCVSLVFACTLHNINFPPCLYSECMHVYKKIKVTFLHEVTSTSRFSSYFPFCNHFEKTISCRVLDLKNFLL